MFRALLTLGGTLDSEGEAKRALAQVAYMRANPLPDNATTNQFDTRVNEFDTHVNPALEMQYTGENYVKLLLESCVPACLDRNTARASRHARAMPLRGPAKTPVKHARLLSPPRFLNYSFSAKVCNMQRRRR